MRSKPFSALFKIFVSFTLVVSLAPSMSWAGENPTGGGSTLTTTPQASDDATTADAAQSDAAQNAAAPRKAPAKAPAATGPAAKIDDAEYATLQAAIDAAEDGDTITLLHDVAEQLSVSAKQITIDCDGHTLSGEGVNGRILSVRPATNLPVDLTVKNGTISGFANANPMIEMSSNVNAAASLIFENCVIKDNSINATYQEDLIYVNVYRTQAGTTLTFNDCQIINNKTNSGDIIKINGSSGYRIQFNLNNTLIANNTSMYATVETSSTTNFNMKNSVIKNNVATGRANYDCSGGVRYYSNTCTVENSAIYNNVLQDSGAAKVTANDMYIYASGRQPKNLSGMIAAKNMVDPFDSTTDFSDMVWKDGKRTGYEEKIPDRLTTECYYTVMPASALQVAQINDDPDKIYETLEAAFAAAGAGDTVKLIAKEQTVDVKEGITVSSDITFDAAEHKVKFAKTDGTPLFTVQPDASLAMYNTQSSDPNNKILGGIEAGSILVEDGGVLTIEDAMDTNGIENNGALTLNALLQDVAVKLGQGKVVQLGAAYDAATSSNTSFNITLDDSTQAVLNDGSGSVVRVVEGGSEAIEPAVKVAGITNGSVVKEYAEGGIQLRIVKAIYLSGSGNDSNTGTKAAPVKTFDHAKELLDENPDYDAIIICNTVPVADAQTWSLPAGKSILRDAAFTGELVHVRAGGALTLENITLDGRRIDAREPLVKVDEGGTLNIQEGADLKNNRNVRQDLYGWGGAVYSAGATNMTGGTIEGNASGFGGGIFQYGGTFNMTGGVIQNNDARLTEPYRGNGGGVFLIAGAKMTMDSGASRPVIRNNTTRGDGGGIALGGYEYVGKNWFITYVDGQAVSLDTSLVMKDGIIDGNSAAISGGGIFVQDSTSAYIYGGEITNNTALGNNARFAGGGIYVNGIHTLIDPETGIRYHDGPGLIEDEEGLTHGFLYLENVEICNNTAKWLGGALATCNVSQTIVGDLSTAIHDNSIENAGVSPSSTSGANVDVFLSSVGHGNTNVGSSHPLAYLSNYMIGGGDYAWTNSRSAPIDPAYLYENRVSTQAVTPASSDSSEMQTATAGAKVLISGNYGGANGGGLGSNGIIVLGSIAPKVDVAVTKEWASEIETASRPTSLKFNLYRAAGQSGAKELYKTQIVEADENGAIAYTWDNLLKYVPDTNNQTEYVYTVEEDLSYEAKDASGNAVNLQALYFSTASREKDSAREIRRPQPDGTVATSSQPVYQWKVSNTPKNPVSVELPVSKTVETEGAAAPYTTFTFELEASPTTPNSPLPEGAKEGKATVSINHSGSEKFAPITFSAAGTYTYLVREVNDGKKGYTYDSSEYSVTYIVTEENSELVCEGPIISKGESFVEEVAFKNLYAVEATTAPGLQVAKTIEGETPAADATFAFVLEPAAGEDTNPMPAEAKEGPSQLITITGEGSARFGEITFTKEGTYTYTVKEIDREAAGYKYDATVYTVTYQVEANPDTAKLEATCTVKKDGAEPTALPEALDFTNTYTHVPNTADGIVVDKHVLGDRPEHAQDFTFVLKPADAANPMPAGTTEGQARISIHGAEEAAFGQIKFEQPGIYRYTVSELNTAASGYSYDEALYTVTYTVTAGEGELNIAHAIDKDGAVQPANTGSLTFSNTFTHVPVQVRIPVVKTIEGDAPSTPATFAFALTAEGTDDPVPAASRVEINGAGSAEFGPITFDAPGTYRYSIEEVLGTAEGYIYDNSIHEVELVVEELAGKLNAKLSYVRDGESVDNVAFNNKYFAPSTPVDVVLVKHLKDALIHEEEFSFGLYDEDNGGKLLDTVYTALGTHTEVGEYSSAVEIAFKDLVFSNPGVYNYTIREHVAGTTQVVEGDEWNQAGFEPGFYKGGVKYDDKEYPVVVTVVEQGKQLEARVDYPTADGDVHELVNEYSEEYIEIDEFDSHPNDGLHEPEPEETDKPTPPTPPADTTKKDNPKTPTTKPSPKAGPVRTSDTNPVAPLSLLALVAAGTAGFAFTRRRKHE